MRRLPGAQLLQGHLEGPVRDPCAVWPGVPSAMPTACLRGRARATPRTRIQFGQARSPRRSRCVQVRLASMLADAHLDPAALPCGSPSSRRAGTIRPEPGLAGQGTPQPAPPAEIASAPRATCSAAPASCWRTAWCATSQRYRGAAHLRGHRHHAVAHRGSLDHGDQRLRVSPAPARSGAGRCRLRCGRQRPHRGSSPGHSPRSSSTRASDGSPGHSWRGPGPLLGALVANAHLARSGPRRSRGRARGGAC